VPVVFVKPTGNAPIDLSERLISHCQQHLADFKVIRNVHIVNDFPRATLQKIAKYKLRERLPAIE
jgi:crotonobetaine/carnitine-CoA ligase